MEIVNKKYDKINAAARGYVDLVHGREIAEQYTSHHSKSGSHMTSSKRSSQRQGELKKSKLKREELEKQHEAELRIASQRHEMEKQTQIGNSAA